MGELLPGERRINWDFTGALGAAALSVATGTLAFEEVAHGHYGVAAVAETAAAMFAVLAASHAWIGWHLRQERP